MISVRITHNAGLGSLFTVLISQLLKIPENEVVHVYATSKLYAPNGENIFDWFFANPHLESDATLWPGESYDEAMNPFNTKLGDDKPRLERLRSLRRRRLKHRLGIAFNETWAQTVRRMASLDGGRVPVGIHYRGTDKSSEVPRVSYEAVLASYQKHGRGRPVFLATDEQTAAEWFAARIPTLIMNPHQRSSDQIGVHIANGGQRQAYEAMADIFCLAYCQPLLVGRGNFSDMACIFGDAHDIHYHEDSE